MEKSCIHLGFSCRLLVNKALNLITLFWMTACWSFMKGDNVLRLSECMHEEALDKRGKSTNQ